MNGDLSQQIFIYSAHIGFLLISLSIHEAAHAIVAHWRGDDTAKNLGRLTINPIKHLDLWYSILMPAMLLLASGGKFVFGGAKPVPVNPYKLKHPARDMALVAIAGPLSNLILACIFLLAAVLTQHYGYFPENSLANQVLQLAGLTNLALAVFNMIPIPPLDGSRVMGYLLPRPLAEPYLSLEKYGLILVLVLYVSGVIQPIVKYAIWPMYDGIWNFYTRAIF